MGRFPPINSFMPIAKLEKRRHQVMAIIENAITYIKPHFKKFISMYTTFRRPIYANRCVMISAVIFADGRLCLLTLQSMIIFDADSLYFIYISALCAARVDARHLSLRELDLHSLILALS